MRAFVINLDRAPDRWAFTEAQGARLGIALTRIAATDGTRITDAEQARLVPAEARVTRSELACYLSHTRAWAEIAAGTDSHAAVFEDDILLADDTGSFLTPDWLPADADLVKLTASKRRLKLSLTTRPAHGRELRRLTAPSIDSAGYIISAAHARHLVATTTHFRRAVDRALFDPATGARIYQLTPAIAVQQKFTATSFLPESARASQIQADRAPRPRDISLGKLGQELRNLYRKEIFPRILPALTLVTPEADRILYIPVPFSPGPEA